jgi:hypothetical protein
MSNRVRRSLAATALSTGLSAMAIQSLFSAPVQAIDQSTLLLLTLPLDLQTVTQLWTGDAPVNRSVVAANTIAQANLTLPSLWWAQQQFGSNLLTYWVAFPGTQDAPARVELLVDELAWSRATYFDRYTFLSHFGTSARDFGYNVRVFTWRGNLLGAYTCDFAAGSSDSSTSLPSCQIFLGASPPGAFQGTTPFNSQ